MKHFWGIVIIVFICSSCGTMRFNKTSDFAKINDVKDLNGIYLNRINNNSILNCFDIDEYADFVTIASENTNEIKLIYHNISDRKERVINGKMGKNYFEIYFSKRQFFIPLLYSSCDIERIRVGKSKDGKLLIRVFSDQSGNVLFLAAGHSFEMPYKFHYSTEYKDYMPIQENGLWGYANLSGEVVIPARYEFACLFEHDVASVKSNNKWGLINKRGEALTSFKYDDITLIDTLSSPQIFRVFIGEKTGVLDINGNETIPVIYDYIGGYYNGLSSIRLGDKWGYANRTHVVIPAIYSEICSFISADRILVKRDGNYYIVGKDGYEYETRGIWTMRDPKPETKRKIQFEEQIIE